MDRLTEYVHGKYVMVKNCATIFSDKPRKGAYLSNAIVRLAELEDEAERREEGCEWCSYYDVERQDLIANGNGMYDEVIFRYCPVCGKELKELKESQP